MYPEELYAELFKNDELMNRSLEVITVKPDFLGEVDLVTRNGEVLASIRPDVAGGAIMSDENGHAIAHIHENVVGGTSIDLGQGHVINGYQNVYSGETFTSFEGVVGYTKPNFEGGFDFHSATGEQVLSSSYNSMGYAEFSQSINMDLTINSFESVDYFEKVEAITVLLDTSDVTTVLDAADAADGLGFLDWL